MAEQPPVRRSPRPAPAPVRAAGVRSWLSSGLTALTISALGLAVAGSVSLTSNAEVTDSTGTLPQTTLGQPQVVPTVPAGTPSPADGPSFDAFPPAPPTTSPPPARSAELREAIIRERAAQRAEDLAKAAEAITRSARTQSSEVRQQSLAQDDRARRQAEAKEYLRRAVAARVAATTARQAAEGTGVTDPTAPVDPTTIPADTGGGVSPVPGAVIGAHFGQYGLWARYHTGLDFRASQGTPIRAVEAGTVLYAGNSGDWAGNHVAVQHASGMTTMYSHMSAMAVQAGATVQAGQVIGYVGQTGRAFGAHLHFELYPPGVKYGDIYKAIDPQPWLASIGVQTH